MGEARVAAVYVEVLTPPVVEARVAAVYVEAIVKNYRTAPWKPYKPGNLSHTDSNIRLLTRKKK